MVPAADPSISARRSFLLASLFPFPGRANDPFRTSTPGRLRFSAPSPMIGMQTRFTWLWFGGVLVTGRRLSFSCMFDTENLLDQIESCLVPLWTFADRTG
jgi:hypothetical protein